MVSNTLTLSSLESLSGSNSTTTSTNSAINASPLASSSTASAQTVSTLASSTPLTIINSTLKSTQTLSSVGSTSRPTGISASGTNSPTSRPTPPSAGGSAGISSGAIAGIVIGCIAAVALTAGLFFWFFVRQRRISKQQYAQAARHTRESPEKGFPLATVSPSDGGAASIETFPQPLEDQAITGHVSKLSNAIKNHVQSYYHNNLTGPRLPDNDAVRALGSGLPLSVEALTSLMGNVATREIALRFVIAWAVISRMHPSSDSSKSLLPTEVARYYENTTYQHPGSQVQPKSTARWRAMASELSRSNYARTPFVASDSRHSSILALAAILERILQPYGDPRMNNEERKRNLEEVLKRAALIAFTLFSQPSTFEFEWQKEQSFAAGELCVFPALVQVADETGQKVNPPRTFSDAVSRRVDI